MSRRFIVEPAYLTTRTGSGLTVWIVVDTTRAFLASVHRTLLAAEAQAAERNRCFEDAR